MPNDERGQADSIAVVNFGSARLVRWIRIAMEWAAIR
jgi:hypothetical protein